MTEASRSGSTSPVEIEITGAAFIYDLDPAPTTSKCPPPRNWRNPFPGIRRILREAHVRYAFVRFGVPYVVSIQCYDRRPSPKYLSCREADPIAVKFCGCCALPAARRQPVASRISI